MRESPKPEARSEAFSELRKQSHAQIEQETAERVKANPKPSEEEINAGAFPEMLEPQVRDAIFEMRKKGYATESSGFGGKTGEVQSMDGYFEIDAKTEQELRDMGVDVLRDQGFGPSYSFIRFSPDEPSLEKMKAKWDAVARLLPDLGRKAEPSISGHAEEFLTKYASERADVLQRITELRAQHDREQEQATAQKAMDTEETKTARLAREQEIKASDQAKIDAIRESVGLKPEENSLERYSLNRVTIEAITRVREMPGRMKDFSWPLELQGKGSTNEEEKSMLVRFPKGDIFLSFATTIHELGHLRQEELDPKLKKEEQTHENLLAQEQDAWDRGWQRFLKSNPDVAVSLEAKFQEHRREEKLKDFASFRELYQWIRENALRMVEAQRILFEESGEGASKPSEKQFDQLADEMEKAGIRNFLARFEKARIGEIVNEDEMRKMIEKTLRLVIEG